MSTVFGLYEQTRYDATAVRDLYREVLPAGTKGAPLAASSLTLGELAASGWNAFDGPLPTPLLVLRDAALAHNVAAMAAYCQRNDALFAPHGKTTMSPQIFARQIDAGAWAMTAATPNHLRTYRRFGIGRVLLANQLVEPAAIAWIAAELARDPEFELLCLVDSVEGVARLSDELAHHRATRPVEVLLEVGHLGGRSGVRDVASARRVAAAARRAHNVELRGVEFFEGLVTGRDTEHALELVDAQLERVAAIATDLAERDEIVGEPLLSAGGSAYFDRVVAVLGESPGRLVLRSGCYVTQDGGFYSEVSPLGRRGGDPTLREAIELWSAVLSRPEPELVITSMGKRDAPYDLGLPQPSCWRARGGRTGSLAGATVVALSDQHAHVRVPADAELGIGDLVRCSISHPCGAFDRWQVIPVLDDQDRIVDAVRTFF